MTRKGLCLYQALISQKLLGATYTRDSFGPYAVELDEILENMLESDELDFIKHTYHGHTQKKYLPHNVGCTSHSWYILQFIPQSDKISKELNNEHRIG